MTNPKWKQFEIAVAAFISALDSNAIVTHDAMLPDIDTGTLRQRDVWIETKVCEHFSLKILVSCKRYKSKLNQQHMDAFIGELASSGAQKGVIYSYSGFTKPALEKAHVKGISCCQLYQNQTPTLPESLIFDAYLFTPAVHFQVHWLKQLQVRPKTVNELLNLDLSDSNDSSKMTLLDQLEEKYYEQRKKIRARARESGDTPTDWVDRITFKSPQEEEFLIVEFGGAWDVYKALLEGYIINGSYSFTEKEFKGEQSFPDISKHGPNPGDSWVKIDELPKDLDKKSVIGVLYGGEAGFRQGLLNLGDNKI